MKNTAPSETLTVKDLCGHSMCKDKGAYSVKAACMNCDWKGNVQITRGHEFSRYSKSCPVCACHTLTRVSS